MLRSSDGKLHSPSFIQGQKEANQFCRLSGRQAAQSRFRHARAHIYRREQSQDHNSRKSYGHAGLLCLLPVYKRSSTGNSDKALSTGFSITSLMELPAARYRLTFFGLADHRADSRVKDGALLE
mmetsp:Transcript_68546/g.135498  ORF Transcript_68546/g.135498 Transcript_68546/m.135498 type:complete len:124 (+) Transcript_68546:355-726(+)